MLFTGDQAEITFTLIGEPPFTFTYQRSELAPKKGGIGKVLETHTVSRIYKNEYSIFSALEGMPKRHLSTRNSDLSIDRNVDGHIHFRPLLSLSSSPA